MNSLSLKRLPAAVALAASLYLVGLAPLACQASAAVPAAPASSAASQTVGGIVDKSGTDTSIPGKEYYLTPKTGDATIQPLVGRFAQILIGLTGSLALLIFVWAGITMITADGDAKKVDAAKKMMIWTVVGLIVIFSAESLLRLVFNTLLKGTAS